MLVKQNLISDLKKIGDDNQKVFDSIRSEADSMKSQIGQGKTHKEFTDDAAKMADDRTSSMLQDTIDAQAEALADYLNGMVDMTQDGLMVKIQPAQVRPIFANMASMSGEESFGKVAQIDAKVAQVWTGLFPLTFKLSTPPPGSVKKVSSIGAPSALGSVAGLYQGKGTFDQYVKNLAGIFHTAATSIPITINHLIPSSGGPVPGPPISGVAA